MRRAALPAFAGLALAGLCACGGSRTQEPPPVPLPDATRAVGALLLAEASPASPSALPGWKVQPGTSALQLSQASALGCTTSELTSNLDGSSTLKLTFACSNSGDGTTLSGALWFTFAASAPGSYHVEYKALRLVKGTQSWTVNGTKLIAVNPAASRATLSTPAPMTMAFVDTADPAGSRTLSYGCILVSDWSQPGNYRLSGSFALQSGNAQALVGTIPDQQPLGWTAGCCHPVSGSLLLTQGTATSEVRFSTPCGSYTVGGYATLAPIALPGCTN